MPTAYLSTLAAILLATGCASAPPPPKPATPAEVAHSESMQPLGEGPTTFAETAPPAAAAPSAAPESKAGVIARGEYERMLSQSPGAFLAHVDPVATFRDRRFAGWKLRSFFAGDARFQNTALRPGDVVTRVNGRPIEQPDQFIQVWQNARYRRDLTVEILRDGAPRTLVWAIVD